LFHPFLPGLEENDFFFKMKRNSTTTLPEFGGRDQYHDPRWPGQKHETLFKKLLKQKGLGV
jgi:hypothetical protein